MKKRLIASVTTIALVLTCALRTSAAETAVLDAVSSQAGSPGDDATSGGNLSIGLMQDEGDIATDEPPDGGNVATDTTTTRSGSGLDRAEVPLASAIWPNYPEPQTWGACGIFTDRLKVIRNFIRVAGNDPRRKLAAGTSNLACGSGDSWGYRHIVDGHLQDWKNIASYTNQNWRDVADVFINITLSDPDTVTYQQKSDTFVYCRIAYLVGLRTGNAVGQTFPLVVISVRTTNIITAYPQDDYCRSLPKG